MVLAYPGGEVRNSGELCARMQTLCNEPDKRYSYARPDIREVLVDGTWTIHVSHAFTK
jgi:hypothetical protein